mgnify:CR=1 FL=1
MASAPAFRRRPFALLAVVVAALVVGGLAGCGGSSGKSAPTTTTTSIAPAPKGLPEFYAVKYPLEDAPGRLIKVEKVEAEGLHGTMYRVMYTTRTQQGQIAAVTGLVAEIGRAHV